MSSEKKKKINSRQKGAAGEREWAAFLRSYGIAAIRGQQHSGGHDSPDVKTGLDHKFHFEVKRVEALNLDKAWEQARNDARSEQMPLIAHRRNGEAWKITLDANDFLGLLGHVKTSELL